MISPSELNDRFDSTYQKKVERYIKDFTDTISSKLEDTNLNSNKKIDIILIHDSDNIKSSACIRDALHVVIKELESIGWLAKVEQDSDFMTVYKFPKITLTLRSKVKSNYFIKLYYSLGKINLNSSW